VFIPVKELQCDWNLSVTGVLHVGAHMGEEAPQYEEAVWTPVIWVEAQPNLVQELRQKLDPKLHNVKEAAIFDKNGVSLTLHISSNSQSSSLLNFGTHTKDYPEIIMNNDLQVTTKRLDAVIEQKDMPNFINLDIQGVELKALQSLGNLIQTVKYIYTEVNRLEVYQGCSNIHEIDHFLKSEGFRRVTTRWQWLEGWGDALYLRNDEPKQSVRQHVRSFLKLIYFYKPQAKKLFKCLVTHPKILFSRT
jgi:FkbM family methyltransferase